MVVTNISPVAHKAMQRFWLYMQLLPCEGQGRKEWARAEQSSNGGGEDSGFGPGRGGGVGSSAGNQIQAPFPGLILQHRCMKTCVNDINLPFPNHPKINSSHSPTCSQLTLSHLPHHLTCVGKNRWIYLALLVKLCLPATAQRHAPPCTSGIVFMTDVRQSWWSAHRTPVGFGCSSYRSWWDLIF